MDSFIATMKYINEQNYLAELKENGVIPSGDGLTLEYSDDAGVRGFDFTNLTSPDMAKTALDSGMGGEAVVERKMIEVVFDLCAEMDLYPLRLHAIEDEWGGADPEELLASDKLDKATATLLRTLDESDHLMDVIEIGKEERDAGVNLVTMQFVMFGGATAITSRSGAFLALVSQDDEVSFNTGDGALYEKARAIVRQNAGAYPFDIIFAEPFTNRDGSAPSDAR